LPVNDYRLADELGHLQRFAADLHELRPADARRVDDLHHALVTWAQALPPPPALGLVHRDFYYSQLLFAGPRVTLIDFDLMARGDPALDVANFSAHLYFLGLDRLGEFNALHAEAQAFQEAYRYWAPADRDFSARCAFYTAATYFRLLHVVAPRPGLAHLFEAVLRRTAACLELA
jgi:aminoglycoside phosphotransferase (APT) family kinase protein